MTRAHTYLLDTNVISHVMRNPTGLVAQRIFGREEHEGNSGVCTSLVVQCELLFGLSRRPSQRLQSAYARQMEQLPVLPLEDNVGPHYATLRTHLELAGTPIGANDTLIAAHALALGATLVTADAEFSRVPGLSVENWLQATT